ASDQYVRKRHGKMFDETWKWAGTYRLTGKNIAVPVHEIRERLVATPHCGRARNEAWPSPIFSWGSANPVKDGEARTRYLEAIRAADMGTLSCFSSRLAHDGWACTLRG